MTDRSGRGSGDARRAARSACPPSEPAVSPEDAQLDELGEPDDFRRWLLPPDPYQPLRARWDPTSADEAGTRPPRPDRKQLSTFGRFVSTYGWRAYALPVLTVVTCVVLVDVVRGPDRGQRHPTTSPPAAAAVADTASFGPRTDHDTGGVVGGPPGGDADVALPAGGPFTSRGRGSWHVVRGGTGQVGQGALRVFTYTVEVEDGVSTATFGGDQAVAALVDRTLANPKSWTRDPRFAFRRIDKGTPSFRISLTSQWGTRRACRFDAPVDTSCFNQDVRRVVLDDARWVRGAAAFQGDIQSYRQYMINHEVGHAIGYHQQLPCQTAGGPAPVLMQQTFGTADDDLARLDPAGAVPMDGKVCHVNPWPYPGA